MKIHESHGADSHADIRDAVRALCATFDSAYWQKIDEARGYPEAFVDALTKAGWMAALIPEQYGGSGLSLTETTAINTMNPLRGARKRGSIGQPLAPQELRVVDAKGRPLAAGATGEIEQQGEPSQQEYCGEQPWSYRSFRGFRMDLGLSVLGHAGAMLIGFPRR